MSRRSARLGRVPELNRQGAKAPRGILSILLRSPTRTRVFATSIRAGINQISPLTLASWRLGGSNLAHALRLRGHLLVCVAVPFAGDDRARHGERGHRERRGDQRIVLAHLAGRVAPAAVDALPRE